MAKQKQISAKIFYAVTAVLAALCIVFVLLWGSTGKDSRTGSARMEALCTQSAKYAAGSMHSYEERMEIAETEEEKAAAEAYYRSAVADYNVFLCMYYTIYGEAEAQLADYRMMFDIYNHLLTAPETVAGQLHDFGHTLAELAEDLSDREAMDEMQAVRDAMNEAVKAADDAEATAAE